MSARPVREFHGKQIVAKQLDKYYEDAEGPMDLEDRCVLIGPTSDFDEVLSANNWLSTTKLVVKPDQLIKRRGKAGLLGLNKTWVECVEWITERMGKEQQVEKVSGILDHFIVEPFVPHAESDEYYICIQVRVTSFAPKTMFL